MREILVINGVDYTRHIERKEGMIWTRNDIDTENTVHTKGRKIRRDKIGTKRKITYKLIHMTCAHLAALDDALSETFFHGDISWIYTAYRADGFTLLNLAQIWKAHTPAAASGAKPSLA